VVGRGVVRQAAPEQQAQRARIGERVEEVADDQVRQGNLGRCEALLPIQPGPLKGQVQPFLRPEVVVDQLLVHPGPAGDVGDPGTREAAE
jgi:hypothetical protein